MMCAQTWTLRGRPGRDARGQSGVCRVWETLLTRVEHAGMIISKTGEQVYTCESAVYTCIVMKVFLLPQLDCDQHACNFENYMHVQVTVFFKTYNSPSLWRWWHYDSFLSWIPACYWQIRQISMRFWLSGNPACSSCGKIVDGFRPRLLVALKATIKFVFQQKSVFITEFPGSMGRLR